MIRYGSVCSGVEAASLAWEPLGWKPIFFSEVEPFPGAVLHHRFGATRPIYPLDPDEAHDEADRRMRVNWKKRNEQLPEQGKIINYGDFTKIQGERLRGTVDLLVGGTPCQDLSTMGKRAGFAGLRSCLATSFVELAYRSGVRWIVWENVPGALSSNNGRDFSTFLSLLCGYEVGTPPDGWKNAGLIENASPARFGGGGVCLTLNLPEHPDFPEESRSEESACCLSDIMETGPVPQRYYFTENALRGVLRRIKIIVNPLFFRLLKKAIEEKRPTVSCRILD